MAATSFSNLITFSRGSNATLTGANGLVQWAPMNLVTNSQTFDVSAWNKVNATISANAVVAPDGSTTADNLVEDATTGSHYAQQFVSYVAGFSYTFSAYIKAGIRSWVEVDFPSAAFGSAQGGYFNLTGSGSLGNTTGSPTARTITAVGDGWYRVSVTATATATASGNTLIIAASANGTTSYAGSNGSTALSLWGAQLELGTAPTAYNSTSVKNLLGYSEAFDNAAWTKSNASIVTGAQANPLNGLFNGQKLMENTANAAHYALLAAGTVGNTETLSVYAKAAERNWLYLSLGAASSAYYNLSTGALGTVGGTATITSIGNGWYRCSLTATRATNTNNLIAPANANNGVSYTGDGNSGIYIYGAQLSDSASLDPYVPTPGAAPSSAAYYGPRFDYDPVTLQPKGLLVEEQRTNLLTYSDQFDNAAWTKTSITITANNATSPDGTTNADAIVEDATTGVHRLYEAPACAINTAYTFTAYVKTAGRTEVRLAETTLGGAYFNLATATIGATDPGVTASLSAVGNGWYRCRITATTGGAQTVFVSQIQGAVAGNNSYNGTGGLTALYIWGAQLEAGAFATSYIPTVASTVTRSADVATITGQNFAQWYGQSAGTIVAEVQKFTSSATSTYAYELLGASSSFSMRIRLGTDGRMQSVDGGVVQVDTQIQTPVPATTSKYAVAYSVNDYAGAANGGTVGTDTSATVPAISSLALGSAAVTNLYIRSITYTPVRAADFQLQAATS